MQLVINTCFGGFSLSEKAYEKLIEWGIPVKQYIEQSRDPDSGLYLSEPANGGEVIFDRTLGSVSKIDKSMLQLSGKYWETWLDHNREHPLLIRVVKELGSVANGRCACLEIVDVPDNIEYEISEYDGNEHVAEKHRTWP